jgi:23S rRNA pseudouridine1911/1915/1917 synthase
MLHAWQLGFTHPRTAKWMEFCAPIPDDFLRAGVPADL